MGDCYVFGIDGTNYGANASWRTTPADWGCNAAMSVHCLRGRQAWNDGSQRLLLAERRVTRGRICVSTLGPTSIQ